MSKYFSFRLDQLERQFATDKAQVRRDSFQNFADTLVADGKISRRDQGGIVDFLCSLPEDQATYFQEFLSDRPQRPIEHAEPPELQIAFEKARNAYESGWRNRCAN
jgi:hypothetical protein